MSWSVSASGKPTEVAETLESQFTAMEASPCPEPEETAKQHVRQALKAICEMQRPDSTLKISAWGSQSWGGGTFEKPENVTNALNVSVVTEP